MTGYRIICNDINMLDSHSLVFSIFEPEIAKKKMAKMTYNFISNATKCPPFLGRSERV